MPQSAASVPHTLEKYDAPNCITAQASEGPLAPGWEKAEQTIRSNICEDAQHPVNSLRHENFLIGLPLASGTGFLIEALATCTADVVGLTHCLIELTEKLSQMVHLLIQT